MHLRTSILCTGLALLAPGTALGQDLASRIDAAPADATVRFTYAAKPGVCGNGDNISWNDDDEDEPHTRVRRNGRTYISSGRNRWMDGDCEVGPVRIELTRRNGDITRTRVRVGGDVRSNVTDLGMVSTRAAVDYILSDLIREDEERAAEPAPLAALLADSVEPWPLLLAAARDQDIRRDVRKSAVFWIGQAAADKATEGLESLVGDDDEDVEVRKSAVFALSQQNTGRSIETLMTIARENPEPEVRKSALFWLGQSDDPRVLSFFEEILLGRR